MVQKGAPMNLETEWYYYLLLPK